MTLAQVNSTAAATSAAAPGTDTPMFPRGYARPHASLADTSIQRLLEVKLDEARQSAESERQLVLKEYQLQMDGIIAEAKQRRRARRAALQLPRCVDLALEPKTLPRCDDSARESETPPPAAEATTETDAARPRCNRDCPVLDSAPASIQLAPDVMTSDQTVRSPAVFRLEMATCEMVSSLVPSAAGEAETHSGYAETPAPSDGKALDEADLELPVVISELVIDKTSEEKVIILAMRDEDGAAPVSLTETFLTEHADRAGPRSQQQARETTFMKNTTPVFSFVNSVGNFVHSIGDNVNMTELVLITDATAIHDSNKTATQTSTSVTPGPREGKLRLKMTATGLMTKLQSTVPGLPPQRHDDDSRMRAWNDEPLDMTTALTMTGPYDPGGHLLSRLWRLTNPLTLAVG